MVIVRSSLFYTFLAVVLLSPLPLGSNRPWAWLLVSVIVGTLMVLDAILPGNSMRPSTVRRLIPLVFIWIGCSIWALGQVFFVMPGGVAHPLWFDAAVLTGTTPHHRVSINPQSTLSATMLFLMYGGVFWLAVRLCDSYERAQLALKAFVVAQVVYAVYGLVIFFSGLEMILWFEKWAYHGVLTSTFVNRNSYATFAGIGVLATTTFLFDLLRRDLLGLRTKREFWREFLNLIFKKGWVPFLGIVVTASALLLTASRGGALATMIGFVVLMICFAYVRILPRKLSLWMMGISSFAAIFVFVVSGDVVLERIGQTSLGASVRDEVYQRTGEAILDAPLLGTGYGTYKQAFLPYKTPQISGHGWGMAHNTYIELAMELGVVATGAIILAYIILCGTFVFGMLYRHRRRQFSALALAVTLLVGAHAIVDFSMQIPAVAMSVALIMGLGWSQSWPTQKKRKQG